jgi:hypothetical protein
MRKALSAISPTHDSTELRSVGVSLTTLPSGSITRSQRSSTHSAAPFTSSTLSVGKQARDMIQHREVLGQKHV